MDRISASMLCLFMVLFTGCREDEEIQNTDNPYLPINLDAKSVALVESSNEFGIALFKQVLQLLEGDENALVSPLSVSQVLSMTWNGAKGETRQEMTSVLAFEDDSPEAVNPYQKKLVEALKKSDKLVTMDIANSIWSREEVDIMADFKTVNQENYNAEISALDFNNGARAKGIINDWVDYRTNGKISEIVDAVTPMHMMFLINATYYYGQWKNKFDPSATEVKMFYSEDGGEDEVVMMNQQAYLKFYRNDIFKMVELPYANGHFNMVVILPNENKKVADVVAAISCDHWNDWQEQLRAVAVDLSLPKFKFAFDCKLNESLKTMGMPLAFSQEANFSGITDYGGICISDVKHKTFIEVDEKGTEAAAATSVEMVFTSSGQDVLFPANKPFVFAITEKDTNTILFLGRLMSSE